MAAVSTPSGLGGIGVIRISGDNAIQIADSVFKSISGKKIAEKSGYCALYGEFFDAQGKIDSGVALLFRAPKSYTGENVVELSCHGGSYIAKRLLRACFAAGATPADAGEFTKRAFLNKKLDLIEAESVMELISASGDSQLRLLNAAHMGKTSAKINAAKDTLLNVAAAIAVNADYPDEDIPELEKNALEASLTDISNALDTAICEYNSGKILREGVNTVIIGRPNVGKSTLMNLLSGTNRSIVTDVAGTTRDVIEDTVRVGDLTLHIADTAGLHQTTDTVESVGISLAKERMAAAQLILAVFDCSDNLTDDDLDILNEIKGRNCLVVLNKCDKGSTLSPDDFEGFNVVSVSAKLGEGLESLEEKICDICLEKKLDANAAVLISERQRDCAARAKESVDEALSALSLGLTSDAVGVCIDDAIAALLELTGERVTNEVTDEIFRHFCVGK
ncbi:MAG: tRNA uridine-5-carboxymethylaminomethyl(34) synthesis GTPase MnmE [Clostridia bacterium]|nr:tRNA uridine-5-carboxymethylaminomethyl(34) synthesis GTPase MnmE [Clostridia bacterium]